MYSGSSPQFETEDFPALRRIKPLPKRRRTSTDAAAVHSVHEPDSHAGQPGLFSGDEANGQFTQGAHLPPLQRGGHTL